MRQQYHLARACKPHELRIDGRLVLEDVEAGAADVAGFDEAGEGVLVDDFAACGVDDIGLGTEQLEPPRREEMVGRRRG